MFGFRSKKKKKKKESNDLAKTRRDPKPSSKEVSALTDDGFLVTPSNYQDLGDREEQEDAFALSDLMNREAVGKSGVLAIIADGMGGLALGEEASRIAVQVFLREYLPREPGEPAPERLIRALNVANTAVYDYAFKDGKELELGTTVVAALIEKRDLYWVSAGDSRIYLLRNGSIKQLTRDHIYRNRLMEEVRNGTLTRAEADNHPEGAYLTSYLGLPELHEIDRSESPITLEPKDRIILCSDGLCNTLPDEEIARYFEETERPSAEGLVKEALAREKPHQDNTTVVILSCSADGKS